MVGYRFIPACAGNSVITRRGFSGPAVHPRVCGELLICGTGSTRFAGSSPRVRGTRIRPRFHSRGLRFIPACAGNSFDEKFASDVLPVHPRVCGELSGIGRINRPKLGSSPRVRGTQRCTLQRRAIPGSSPRVRGTLRKLAAKVVRRRFIPACAGNSLRDAASWLGTAVHPRVCGELMVAQDAAGAVNGSSPRVRGTHVRSPQARSETGSSPRVRGTP